MVRDESVLRQREFAQAVRFLSSRLPTPAAEGLLQLFPHVINEPSSGIGAAGATCPGDAFAATVSGLQDTVNVLESSLSLARRLLRLMSMNPEKLSVLFPASVCDDTKCSKGAQQYQGPATRAWVALDYIHGHHADSLLNLARVADAVRLSKWHLARLLREHTGHGFLAHLHEARLRAAKVLLTDPRLTVKEIARAVGYSSVGALDRQFRRQLAMTPSAWRSRQNELLDAQHTSGL